MSGCVKPADDSGSALVGLRVRSSRRGDASDTTEKKKKIEANRELHNMISDQDLAHDGSRIGRKTNPIPRRFIAADRCGGGGARGSCHHGTRRRCRGNWLAARLVAIVLRYGTVPARDGWRCRCRDGRSARASQRERGSKPIARIANSLMAMDLSAARRILAVKKEANFGGGFTIHLLDERPIARASLPRTGLLLIMN